MYTSLLYYYFKQPTVHTVSGFCKLVVEEKKVTYFFTYYRDSVVVGSSPIQDNGNFL